MSILDRIIALSKNNKEIINRIELFKEKEVVTKIWNKLINTKDKEQPFSIVVQREITPG